MSKNKELEFIIDKLTNSIENTISGDNLQTEISLITNQDLKIINKKNGWEFNWISESKKPERNIYKLTIINNLSIIQGLISLEDKTDHIFMHLLESAPFNKGKSKLYAGVPGNLVAFACKHSFQRGHVGYVSFQAKSQLVNHYIETLEAIHIGNRIMVIETPAALKLLDRYFRA